MKEMRDVNAFHELEVMERVERSENLDQLATIVRVVSGNPSLKVTTDVPELNRRSLEARGKNPDEAWFYFEGRETPMGALEAFVHVPTSVLARTPEFSKGAAAHEGAHGKITRLSVIPKEVFHQTGFSSLIGSLEERPTDNYVRKYYGGAGRWIDITRKELELNGLASKETMLKMGYIPEYAQLCNMIVFEPNRHDKTTAHISIDVLDAYEEIRQDVEHIEKILPTPDDNIDRVKELQFKRYETAYLKVWPKMQELMYKDLSDEMMRQMLVDAIRNSRNGDDTLLDKILEGLSEEVRQELKAILREIFEYLDEIEERWRKEQAERAAEQKAAGDAPSGDIPIAIDTFTDEMKKELLEAMGALPEEKKHEYEEKADQSFRDLDDIIARETLGDLAPDNPESHETFDSGRLPDDEGISDAFDDEEEDLDALKKELDQRKEAARKEKSAFEKAYQEIHEYEEDLYRELEEFFHPNQRSHVSLRSTGGKINLPAVFQWTATRKAGGHVVDAKIFEKRSRPEVREYSISLLVDMSASMLNNNRAKETFKAVILLCEVLNRLGISFEVHGFNDTFHQIKEFGDHYGNDTRNKLDLLLDAKKSTDTSSALRRVSRGLEDQPTQEKIIVCMTDGEAKAQNAVAHIIKNTDQKLIGIGVGDKTDSVTNDFPVSIPNVEVKDLSMVVGDLLRAIFTNPTQLNE